MDLLAVVCALESLKTNTIPVRIYSDSKYVIDSNEKGWIYSWHSKGFAKKKNKDLWLRYLSVAKSFKIQFVWVKGHNGHPENERCDVLAVQAALGGNLLVDLYFEEVQQHES